MTKTVSTQNHTPHVNFNDLSFFKDFENENSVESEEIK